MATFKKKIKNQLFPKRVKWIRPYGFRIFNVGGRVRELLYQIKKFQSRK